jgi:hypothetical protein
MSWRVGLIDSCGAHAAAVASTCFVATGSIVSQVGCRPDPTGHGTRIADLLTQGRAGTRLLLAQVFTTAAPTSAAIVAAAVDWAVGAGAELLHLSLGLAADRVVLKEAVARATGCGTIIVASVPARGPPTYPASYPGVIRATGDIRCAPGELSALGAATFGGCPRHEPAGDRPGRGASIGAAQVSRILIDKCVPGNFSQIGACLREAASYVGAEQRGSARRSTIAQSRR